MLCCIVQYFSEKNLGNKNGFFGPHFGKRAKKLMDILRYFYAENAVKTSKGKLRNTKTYQPYFAPQKLTSKHVTKLQDIMLDASVQCT